MSEEELKKRIENLIEDFKRHIGRINELQDRIDKAIEYIKSQQVIFKDYDIVVDNQLKNILEILGGLK